MSQYGHAHCVVGRILGLGKNWVQRRQYLPQQGVGGHAAGKNHRQTRIPGKCLPCCLKYRISYTAQRIGRRFRRDTVLCVILLNLILNARQREGHVCAFYFEVFFSRCLAAQRVQVLSGGKWQFQKLAGAIDQLPCGNIRCTANFRAAYILTIRLHQQKFRRAPGQMPC